jgi:hypothetical protein
MTDQIAYATPTPPSKESGQLRLMSILHYVWGALLMLLASIFIIHVVMGIWLIKHGGPMNFPTATGTAPAASNVPPAVVGYLFAFMGGCAVLVGWAFGYLTILSGRRMNQRRSRIFSIVIAAVNCISFPFGTALGVFTIIILSKDSVKALYGEV